MMTDIPLTDITLEEVRKRLTHQVLSARALPEIEAARQALREWVLAHPEEKGMRAGFEQLAQMQEIAEMLEAEASASAQQAA